MEARAGRLKRWFGQPARWLSFLAGGIPAVLVFPAPSLSEVAWFALVPGMALFARAPSVREAVARGWWFGAGYLIAMLYWMAPEIGPGLVLVGAVFGGLYAPFAIAAHGLLRPPLSWRSALGALVVVPSCWLVPEWVRSYQGLGGPWDLYGASQWQHPAVLALAAIGGVWLVSVALVMANTAIMIILITATSAARTPLRTPPSPSESAVHTPIAVATALSPARVWAVRTLGVAAFIAAAGAGPLAFALTPPFPAVRTVRVALVQPGVVHNPVARADASETLTEQLSRGHPFGRRARSARRPYGNSGPHGSPAKKPDLIVWGESSIAEDLTLPSSRPLLRRIEALSARDGAEILVSQDASPPGKGHEKWGVLVSSSGIKGIYVKTRLVPFGEYIPFRGELGWLTSVSKAAGSNMTPGTGAHLLHAVSRTGKPLPIGVLTCFESAFPDMSRVDADLGAQLIIYQSATSTFQGTWGPDQHASLAALRAAETGRPTVQAALTGDSVAFDARGRQLVRLGQLASGVTTVPLSLPGGSARTFYDRFGDYVMWAGVGISAVAAAVMFARRRGFLGGTAGAADGHGAQYEAGTGQPVAS
ncbi:MAG: apolipoprotein N-acyltransferase [Nocardiopsaceae bacterium]|nr:apolipoprotein N-acyltransferase [Nocardiopsaceae bacterium]